MSVYPQEYIIRNTLTVKFKELRVKGRGNGFVFWVMIGFKIGMG
jgi:hypothetical protein